MALPEERRPPYDDTARRGAPRAMQDAGVRCTGGWSTVLNASLLRLLQLGRCLQRRVRPSPTQHTHQPTTAWLLAEFCQLKSGIGAPPAKE